MDPLSDPPNDDSDTDKEIDYPEDITEISEPSASEVDGMALLREFAKNFPAIRNGTMPFPEPKKEFHKVKPLTEKDIDKILSKNGIENGGDRTAFDYLRVTHGCTPIGTKLVFNGKFIRIRKHVHDVYDSYFRDVY